MMTLGGSDSEILDGRTKNLISVNRISDHVLSNDLVSMSIAMVAEDRGINKVLKELFDADGNELYLRPCQRYCKKGENISFYEMMRRCRADGEVQTKTKLAVDCLPCNLH